MNSTKLRKYIFLLPNLLEVLIGLVISVFIGIAVVGVLMHTAPASLIENGGLMLFLQRMTEIIIGIEFIKLIFSHTMDATLEVIIMAIVRQIIVGHLTSIDTLIFVLAIAIVFVVRKFFFIKKLDRGHEEEQDFFTLKFWNKKKNIKKPDVSIEKKIDALEKELACLKEQQTEK